MGEFEGLTWTVCSSVEGVERQHTLGGREIDFMNVVFNSLLLVDVENDFHRTWE